MPAHADVQASQFLISYWYIDIEKEFKGEERKFSMRLRLKSTDGDEKEKIEFEFFTV